MKSLKNVVILDTETGGLDPLTHSLMTIGLVTGDDKYRLELTVAEPEIVSDPRALAVNRLDPAVVARDGLTPAVACDRIDEYLLQVHPQGRPMVCGHNVAFDLAFMRRLYTMAGRSVPACFSHRTLDTHTLMWALIAVGKLPASVKGSDAAFAHFDIAPPDELRHTALGDAVATRSLLARLLALVGPES
jgi:DNA polymerase-3 subunit epsilon